MGALELSNSYALGQDRSAIPPKPSRMGFWAPVDFKLPGLFHLLLPHAEIDAA